MESTKSLSKGKWKAAISLVSAVTLTVLLAWGMACLLFLEEPEKGRTLIVLATIPSSWLSLVFMCQMARIHEAVYDRGWKRYRDIRSKNRTWLGRHEEENQEDWCLKVWPWEYIATDVALMVCYAALSVLVAWYSLRLLHSNVALVTLTVTFFLLFMGMHYILEMPYVKARIDYTIKNMDKLDGYDE